MKVLSIFVWKPCGCNAVSPSTALSGSRPYLPPWIYFTPTEVFFRNAKVIGKGVPRRHLFLFSSSVFAQPTSTSDLETGLEVADSG